MEQSDLTVRRIKDGTVIDHIDVGNGLKVLEALQIDGSDGNVITIALNVPSGKLKKKDMIKVAGFNVYPRDVEDVLYENENVLEAAAVGMKNKDLSEYIKAFVVFKKGKTASEEELIEFCRTKLTGYKVPKEIEFRKELPKSLIGKILRKSLKNS